MVNFKPTKWKVIISVLMVIIWGIFFTWMNSSVQCNRCALDYSCESNDFLIIRPACGKCAYCYNILEIVRKNLFNVLFPFALVYILWSLIEKKKKK